MLTKRKDNKYFKVGVFCDVFSLLIVFHLFLLGTVVINQKASTEADVISRTDGVLKHAPDKIGVPGRERFIIKTNKVVHFNNCDATNSTFFI